MSLIEISGHDVIHGVFYILLKENGFASITVTDIVKAANINRSTFYAHFEDKYDLLNEYEKNLIEKMLEANIKSPIKQVISGLQEKSEENLDSLIKEYFLGVATFFRQNGEAIYVLVNENASCFLNIISDAIQAKWHTMGLERGLIIPQNYAVTIFASIVIGVITEWVKNNFKETDDEFADILVNSIFYLPKGMYESYQLQ